LIGLRFGLLLSVAAILEVLLSPYRNALIPSYSWERISLFVRVLLLIIRIVFIL
jgi:hypothetical protein